MSEAAQLMNDDERQHFYNAPLKDVDPDVYQALEDELVRESEYLELIASENTTSRAVMQANGSMLTNKYAEGYPGKRFYNGCGPVDDVEQMAIDRACQLFNCKFANVQPHSGSQANQAVYLALVEPGAPIVSMALDHGGHLTHGHPANMSGKWFDVKQYGVNNDGVIDFDQVEKLVAEHKPKMLICGASAYSRVIDWERFRKIADTVGAYLLADIAHYAGLVAGGAIPNPLDHVHVATMTTHKSLRGPSGGMILWNDEELTKPINSALFPGLQGKPLAHVLAAKAVAFGQALKPEFKVYAHQIVKNAKALADALMERGYDIVSDGTDTHVMLVDLQKQGIIGLPAQRALSRAHLNCNRNTVPNDPQSAWKTSGIRLGSPAGTTRGLKEPEFRQVGYWIAEVLDGLQENGEEGNQAVEEKVAAEVKELLAKYPIYESAL